MSKGAVRTLIATVMGAACLAAAIPKGSADGYISVDTNPGTPTPAVDDDVSTIGNKSVSYTVGVGNVPWPLGGGGQGAWIDAWERSNTAVHTLAIVVGCSSGGSYRNGPVSFGTVFFPFVDLDVLCPAGTTASTGLGVAVPQ